MGWDSLKNEFIKNYTEAFTSKELRELVIFYKNTHGQKALQTIPSLMQKSAKKGQERVQAALPELLKELGVNE